MAGKFWNCTKTFVIHCITFKEIGVLWVCIEFDAENIQLLVMFSLEKALFCEGKEGFSQLFVMHLEAFEKKGEEKAFILTFDWLKKQFFFQEMSTKLLLCYPCFSWCVMALSVWLVAYRLYWKLPTGVLDSNFTIGKWLYFKNSLKIWG